MIKPPTWEDRLLQVHNDLEKRTTKLEEKKKDDRMLRLLGYLKVVDDLETQLNTIKKTEALTI